MQTTTHTARLWLGAGAALLTAALIIHGPPDPDLTKQLRHIAEGGDRWAIAHWAAAVALFLLSGGAFLMLLGRAAGEAVPGHPGAWMVMALGALTTVTTAVAEASVVSVAAHAGDQAAFDTWWAFSSGMANGFFALAIAVGLIALAAAPAAMGLGHRHRRGLSLGAGLEPGAAARHSDRRADLADLDAGDVPVALLVRLCGPHGRTGNAPCCRLKATIPNEEEAR